MTICHRQVHVRLIISRLNCLIDQDESNADADANDNESDDDKKVEGDEEEQQELEECQVDSELAMEAEGVDGGGEELSDDDDEEEVDADL